MRGRKVWTGSSLAEQGAGTDPRDVIATSGVIEGRSMREASRVAYFEISAARFKHKLESQYRGDLRRRRQAWDVLRSAQRRYHIQRQLMAREPVPSAPVVRHGPETTVEEDSSSSSSASMPPPQTFSTLRDGRVEHEHALRQYSAGGRPGARDLYFWQRHPNILMARMMATWSDDEKRSFDPNTDFGLFPVEMMDSMGLEQGLLTRSFIEDEPSDDDEEDSDIDQPDAKNVLAKSQEPSLQTAPMAAKRRIGEHAERPTLLSWWRAKERRRRDIRSQDPDWLAACKPSPEWCHGLYALLLAFDAWLRKFDAPHHWGAAPPGTLRLFAERAARWYWIVLLRRHKYERRPVIVLAAFLQHLITTPRHLRDGSGRQCPIMDGDPIAAALAEAGVTRLAFAGQPPVSKAYDKETLAALKSKDAAARATNGTRRGRKKNTTGSMNLLAKGFQEEEDIGFSALLQVRPFH